MSVIPYTPPNLAPPAPPSTIDTPTLTPRPAPSTAVMPPTDTGAAPPGMVPPSMQLPRNPQLPQHPLGAYTDSIYEAAIAQLQNQIAKQYADILQQLGYVDESGNFVQGSVEANARRNEADLRRQADIATEGVTKEHQQLGTLFSGLRGTDQARATQPMTNQISQIETDTPLSLQQLYEKASGLTNDYVLSQNQLLADAAARAAGNQLGNPSGGPTTGGTETTIATTPPPPAPIALPYGGGGIDQSAIVAAAQANPTTTKSAAEQLLAHLSGSPAPPPPHVGAYPNLIAGPGSQSQKRLLPQVGF